MTWEDTSVKYRQASLEAENVEKIQETPAECSKASPKAENVEKTQEDTLAGF